MATEYNHNGTMFLGLTRVEALEIVCQLTAQLANNSLGGLSTISKDSCINLSITDKGCSLHRLVIGLEEKMFERI